MGPMDLLFVKYPIFTENVNVFVKYPYLYKEILRFCKKDISVYSHMRKRNPFYVESSMALHSPSELLSIMIKNRHHLTQ